MFVDGHGQQWTGSTFESPVNSNWYLYARPNLEATSGNYLYTNHLPGNLPAGRYDVYTFVQSGNLPALTDTMLSSQIVDFDGSGRIGVQSVNARIPVRL